MMNTLVAALLASIHLAHAHVTLVPNYGAPAGNYFQFQVKIPHGGKDGEGVSLDTTKIRIDVPHGVLSVTPEAVYGWDISVTERNIVPYESHGQLKSKAPATITYTAKCEDNSDPPVSTPEGTTCFNNDHGGLDHEHLMLLTMQVKLGCDFGVEVNGDATNDATIWRNEHTIWWPVHQWYSTKGTNDGNNEADADAPWDGIRSGQQGWEIGSMMDKPAPFLHIYSHYKCQPADSTNPVSPEQYGMRWGEGHELVPPAENMDAVKNKAEVISLMNEQNLELNADIADLKSANRSIMHMACTAIALAGLVFGIFLTLLCLRMAKPTGFREYLLADFETGKKAATVEIA
jgi:hypothetical protein